MFIPDDFHSLPWAVAVIYDSVRCSILGTPHLAASTGIEHKNDHTKQASK